MGWRAFVGQWGKDEVGRHLDVRAATWEQAREELLGYLFAFEGDGCDDCRETGAHAAGELRDLSSGSPWRGELDGEDLLLSAE
jgi:hypothetical protein